MLETNEIETLLKITNKLRVMGVGNTTMMTDKGKGFSLFIDEEAEVMNNIYDEIVENESEIESGIYETIEEAK